MKIFKNYGFNKFKMEFKSKAKKFVMMLMTDILLTLLLIAVLLIVFQRSFIYKPSENDFYFCPGFQEAEKLTFDGTRFYYRDVSDRIVVFYHGNAGTACDRSDMKNFFLKHNLSYIFVEYSGYANDSSKPSQDELFKDSQNIVTFLKTLDYDEVIVVGESLGTGLATYHASISDVDKVILISTFDEFSNVVKRNLMTSVLSGFLYDDYDNVKSLRKFAGDTLIIHGVKDEVMPISLARNLHSKVHGSIFIEVEDAGHNDIFFNTETLESMSAFLDGEYD